MRKQRWFAGVGLAIAIVVGAWALRWPWIAVESAHPVRMRLLTGLPSQRTPEVNFTVGVVQGIHTSGHAHVPWTSTALIQMVQPSYNADSNHFPIQGTVTNHHSGDLVVQVVPVRRDGQEVGGDFWMYSIPVRQGVFAATIVLPYHGYVEINVGTAELGSAFSVAPQYAYIMVFNPQPTLSLQAQGLLQSWLVNYNESTAIARTAHFIVAGASTPDAKMAAISHWVSAHIAYDWPENNSRQVTWQQASTTLVRHVGVCQDESGLAAALLRSIGIPTVTLAGELVEHGQDLGPHQWDEGWNGHTWVQFDPTLNQIYHQNQFIALPYGVLQTYFGGGSALWASSHLQVVHDDW